MLRREVRTVRLRPGGLCNTRMARLPSHDDIEPLALVRIPSLQIDPFRVYLTHLVTDVAAVRSVYYYLVSSRFVDFHDLTYRATCLVGLTCKVEISYVPG